MMYNSDYYDWNTPTGWRCPVCGKIWAPHVSFCSYCNEERKTFASTKVDDIEWWKRYLQNTTSDFMNDIKVYTDNSTYVQKEEPENMNWRDWLDAMREQTRKEANLK